MAYKKLKLWFDKDLAELLSAKIVKVFPKFQVSRFIEAIETGVENLELKDRVSLIADELREELPEDYEQAIIVLKKIIGPENEKETGMFTEGYWLMPIASFVEQFGMDHFDASIAFIKEITKRNTGEYCIRPFLEKFPDRTLNVMEVWSKDENVHVRRLACEGTRPRLPWAKKLDQFIIDPSPIFPILERLKDDPSKYVQKSVANNLNDILKDNYEVGMTTLKSWAKDATSSRKWIIKHALRTQLKKKNKEAQNLVNQIS